MKISKDINVNDFGGCYTTHCVKCEKEINLWWNHGELDWSMCCGVEYSLEHKIVELVIKEGK